MQALVRTSPDRLASRYGLLAGGANALLDVAILLIARSGLAVLIVALSPLNVALLVGSAVLFVHLGYVSVSHGGTIGVAARLGVKAGILYGLVVSVGTLVYLACADWLFHAMSLSAADLVASVLFSAFLGSIFAALFGAALAMLGAAVAQRRARA